jgi:KaiC/GvpD/RAD55 family RecA-like ATPase
LFVEFDGSPEQLYRNARFFGWDLEKHVKDGSVQVVCYCPEEGFILQSEGGIV